MSAGQPDVGRILTATERANRQASEAAAGWAGEPLRSAFAISARHVLTAWHNVRDLTEPLWFRVRITDAAVRRDAGASRVVYLPVRCCNLTESFDVAVLELDPERLIPDLADEIRTPEQAEAVLGGLAIPLSVDLTGEDRLVVKGYPATAPSSDTAYAIDARVIDLGLDASSTWALIWGLPPRSSCSARWLPPSTR